MPLLRDIEVGLVRLPRGERIPEYPHPDTSSSGLEMQNITSTKLDPKVSVYIPSKPSCAFGVHFAVKSIPAQCRFLLAKVYVNGRIMGSWGVNPKDTPETIIGKSLWAPTPQEVGIEGRQLVFSPKENNKSAADDGGLIEVLVFRATARSQRAPKLEAYRGDKYDISAMSVGMMDRPEGIGFFKFQLVDATCEPYVRFRFHYRSLESLVQLNLVPGVSDVSRLPSELAVYRSSTGTVLPHRARLPSLTPSIKELVDDGAFDTGEDDSFARVAREVFCRRPARPARQVDVSAKRSAAPAPGVPRRHIPPVPPPRPATPSPRGIIGPRPQAARDRPTGRHEFRPPTVKQTLELIESEAQGEPRSPRPQQAVASLRTANASAFGSIRRKPVPSRVQGASTSDETGSRVSGLGPSTSRRRGDSTQWSTSASRRPQTGHSYSVSNFYSAESSRQPESFLSGGIGESSIGVGFPAALPTDMFGPSAPMFSGTSQRAPEPTSSRSPQNRPASYQPAYRANTTATPSTPARRVQGPPARSASVFDSRPPITRSGQGVRQSAPTAAPSPSSSRSYSPSVTSLGEQRWSPRGWNPRSNPNAMTLQEAIVQTEAVRPSPTRRFISLMGSSGRRLHPTTGNLRPARLDISRDDSDNTSNQEIRPTTGGLRPARLDIARNDPEIDSDQENIPPSDEDDEY